MPWYEYSVQHLGSFWIGTSPGGNTQTTTALLQTRGLRLVTTPWIQKVIFTSRLTYALLVWLNIISLPPIGVQTNQRHDPKQYNRRNENCTHYRSEMIVALHMTQNTEAVKAWYNQKLYCIFQEFQNQCSLSSSMRLGEDHEESGSSFCLPLFCTECFQLVFLIFDSLSFILLLIFQGQVSLSSYYFSFVV